MMEQNFKSISQFLVYVSKSSKKLLKSKYVEIKHLADYLHILF